MQSLNISIAALRYITPRAVSKNDTVYFEDDNGNSVARVRVCFASEGYCLLDVKIFCSSNILIFQFFLEIIA